MLAPTPPPRRNFGTNDPAHCESEPGFPIGPFGNHHDVNGTIAAPTR